jgi:hypothetical protein
MTVRMGVAGRVARGVGVLVMRVMPMPMLVL